MLFLVPNVDVIDVSISHDELDFDCSAVAEMTECFRAFQNVTNVTFGYPVHDLRPFNQFYGLKFLRLDCFKFSLNALAFKLPSVTHLVLLVLVVKNYKPNLPVAEFLSGTFPNLEVLQFDIVADEELIDIVNTTNASH